jgi:hypothetical protein
MTYYIILYCTIHDDGFVVKSETIDMSEDFNINCKCEGSNLCDFIYNGTLHIDGTNIIEIVPILRNYDRYGGGFKFEFYKDCCDDELLKQWIINNL